MRVPMLARCPELFTGGTVVNEVVAGLDIMPTVLDAAGVSIPDGLDGRSMLPLLTGKGDPQWRKELLYEYYWERNFPQTPTMHCAADGPLQIHPLLRHLGYRRALRSAGRSAGNEQPDLQSRSGKTP